MKKIITLTAALLLSVASFAFNPQWGVRAGLNLASLSNHGTVSDYSHALRPDFYAGASMEVPNILGFFDLRTELSFSKQGNRTKSKLNEEVFANRSAYLNLPVMLEYKMLDDKLAFLLGPQVGLCFGGKNIRRDSGSTTKVNWERGQYTRFDFGIVLGAAFTFYRNISVECRYNLGLTNAYRGNLPFSIGEYNGVTHANRVLQIGLSYAF